MTMLVCSSAGSNIAVTIRRARATRSKPSRRPTYRRREHFHVHRYTAVPMEPRGLLAEWDAAQRTPHALWRGQGAPSSIGACSPSRWDLPESAIRMVENDVGGGFGVRGEFYPEDFLIPFAARQLDRPVKWIEDRREHLLATNHARDVECELEIACDADGTILGAARPRLCRSSAPISAPTASPPRATSRRCMSGPYRIPNIHIDVSLHGDQQDAGRHLSRARALRGGFLPRAPVRHGGEGSGHRPRRVPPHAISSPKRRCPIALATRPCRSTSAPNATAANIA